MKKFILFLITVNTLFASTQINWQDSYQNAIKKAKRFGVPIFIMVSSDECPECNYMKREILNKMKMASKINNNYISYNFLFGSKELPQGMRMWGIPRFYIIEHNGSILFRHIGSMTKNNLNKVLDKYILKYKKILRKEKLIMAQDIPITDKNATE